MSIRIVLSLIAVLVASVRAMAQDRAQPDVSEILRDIREGQTVRDTLEFTIERQFSLADRDGESQYAIQKSRTRVRVVLQPDRFRVDSSFNGTTVSGRSRSYSRTVTFDGTTTRYSNSKDAAEKAGRHVDALPSPELFLCPREPNLTLEDWLAHGEPAGEDKPVAGHGVDFESVEAVHGLSCVRVLLSTFPKSEPELATARCRLWLAPERGYAVARVQKMKRVGPDPLIVTEEGSVTKWLELPDATWLPAEGTVTRFAKSAEGERRVHSTEKFVVNNVSLTPSYPESLFRQEAKTK